MKTHYSTIIIGAGSVGMATGYYLGEKGIDTLLLDTDTPPHENGSHHGQTRLIRHAVGEGENYIPLILRAQELWNELEEKSDKKLFYKTGTVLAGAKDSEFINKSQDVARKFSLNLEKLSLKEFEENMPFFSIPKNFTGYYEPSSGVLLNEKIIEAYKTLIKKQNVHFQPDSKVNNITPSLKGNIVETDNQTYYADKVIVTAGAWIKQFTDQLNLNLPIQTVRKTFGWFSTKNSIYTHLHFPCFYFNFENQKYYGFPSINGSSIKIGRNDSEQNIYTDDMKNDFGKYKRDKADLELFAKKYIPKISDYFNYGKACMITKTPDKDFIIDKHPYFDNIIIAGGFSGHGFKYSSVIGEILRDLIMEKKIDFDISPFSITRASLIS